MIIEAHTPPPRAASDNPKLEVRQAQGLSMNGVVGSLQLLLAARRAARNAWVAEALKEAA